MKNSIYKKFYDYRIYKPPKTSKDLINSTDKCSICDKPFDSDQDIKVVDHDNFTR